jgi:hypothetical protein
MVGIMPAITLPNGYQLDTDTIKTATFWAVGTSTGERGVGEGFILRQKPELYLVSYPDVRANPFKGAEAQQVYDQLKAIEFPRLFWMPANTPRGTVQT